MVVAIVSNSYPRYQAGYLLLTRSPTHRYGVMKLRCILCVLLAYDRHAASIRLSQDQTLYVKLELSCFCAGDFCFSFV